MRATMRRLPTLIFVSSVCVLVMLSAVGVRGAPTGPVDLTPTAYVYVPLVRNDRYTCPTTSDRQYDSGVAYQWDTDDPVRPAWNHADKNLELRSYSTVVPTHYQMVWYDVNNTHQPPQFATMFSPNRVPDFVGYYRVHDWIWPDPPDSTILGTRGGPNTNFRVSALGLETTPGEVLYVPESGYSLSGGMEVIVLFADEDSITLRYARGDSVTYASYTMHVDKICTDPNLLALYNSLDDPNGPRYDYPSSGYNLPNLPAGKAFGTAAGEEVVVAIANVGCFMDPRSCTEYWEIQPGYTGDCPHHEGSVRE